MCDVARLARVHVRDSTEGVDGAMIGQWQGVTPLARGKAYGVESMKERVSMVKCRVHRECHVSRELRHGVTYAMRVTVFQLSTYISV